MVCIDFVVLCRKCFYSIVRFSGARKSQYRRGWRNSMWRNRNNGGKRKEILPNFSWTFTWFAIVLWHMTSLRGKFQTEYVCIESSERWCLFRLFSFPTQYMHFEPFLYKVKLYWSRLLSTFNLTWVPSFLFFCFEITHICHCMYSVSSTHFENWKWIFSGTLMDTRQSIDFVGIGHSTKVFYIQ